MQDRRNSLWLPFRRKNKTHDEEEQDWFDAVPLHWLDSVIYIHSWPSFYFTHSKIKTGIFLQILRWQLLGYFWCFFLILSRVLPGEANGSWNWFVLNDISVCRSVVALPHPLCLPAPPCWLPFSLPKSSSACDGFCNECSLMWRRSRVKQSA